MTPDELPDDMEALIERVALPWLEEAEQSFDTDELAKAGQAVRALLKAYQERGRTPAPEGKVVAWRARYKPGGSAALWTAHAADPRPSWPPAVVADYEVQPLYASPAPEGEAVACTACEGRPVFPNVPCAVCAASPVVSVKVRERVLDELDGAWLHGQRRTSWRRDESADAIIAALGTKGADHD
jgi:hypothetical protein